MPSRRLTPRQRQHGRDDPGLEAVSAFWDGDGMESDKDRGSPEKQERTGKTGVAPV